MYVGHSYWYLLPAALCIGIMLFSSLELLVNLQSCLQGLAKTVRLAAVAAKEMRCMPRSGSEYRTRSIADGILLVLV